MSKLALVPRAAAPDFEKAVSFEPQIQQQQRPRYSSPEDEALARQQQQAQCYNW